MYIKIENNVLTSWADWNFPESSYVEVDYDYFNNNQDRFDVVDGVLTDISNTVEYQAQQLTKLRQQKLLENKQALEQKESLTTSLGQVKIQTPIGKIDVVVTSMLNLAQITQVLPAGFLRVYVDGVETPSPSMTLEEVVAFYMEVAQKIKAIDTAYKQYEAAINSASTQEELDSIEIDYSAI